MEQNTDILKQKRALLAERFDATLGAALGIEIVSAEPDEVTATMPVDHRTKQPFGLLHGGASAALAETVASIGGWLSVPGMDTAVVGVEINANHLRPARAGRVRAQAKPLKRGARIQVWDVRITTEEGSLLCAARCTLAVLTKS
ncbi:MAG: hotdog fold thioesterase [Bdellovibrionales bacterium]|nr:hotdog fold thioesterase [Bdellovibrionales bacterium]